MIATAEPEGDLLAHAELVIREPGADLKKARDSVRAWLLNECGDEREEGSIAEAIHTLAHSQRASSRHAAVALRYLSVSGLIVSAKGDSLDRAVVALAEKTSPALVSILRIQPKQQTFQKFAALENAHAQVCGVLAPLQRRYGDIESLLSSRREILGALNHSLVREYCDVFRLNDIRSTVELVFSRCKRVAALEPTMLADYEDFERALVAARDSIPEIGSFLAYDYLQPFLSQAEKTLAAHLNSVRARLKARIKSVATSGNLAKRYPLAEAERQLRISMPLLNEGPGLATDVRVTAVSLSDSVYLADFPIHLGNVSPGPFAVVLDALVLSPASSFSGAINISWGEIGSPHRAEEQVEFSALAQSSQINWSSLTHWTPYSTDVAEGDDFVGREERVGFVSSKMLRETMEPFYITGQKRVGKTSLVKAATSNAARISSDKKIEWTYILWGAVAHESPNASLNALGQRIETMLHDQLGFPLGTPNSDFSDSLSGLVSLAERALKLQPEKRFVVIIDEFDEIHPELYLQGNLADTFFANLRALSRCKNICVALVGGENMPFVMDRQGQKLNNFSRINLSSYSRLTEWEDFRLLVEEPTKNILTWHDEAVSEVYNASSGNPYFAKVVCAQVARNAVAERDVDISGDEVRRALDTEVSILGPNFFAHLWRDGIAKPAAEQEPDVLRRTRLLVAFARCVRKGIPTTAQNIAECRTSAALGEGQVVAVINDFIRREIIKEQDGRYDIVLPIFQKWLVDVGAGQLMADELSEELSESVLAEENAALVRSEEVVALTKQWPPYQGRHVGVDDVRSWMQQVDNLKDQRILFELLKRTRFFSEVEVRDRLKTAHAVIRPSLPEFVIRQRNERRSDVVVTYVDGAGKSGASYASLYAEANGIAAANVISPDGFRKSFGRLADSGAVPAAVIIVDDIAATGGTLSEKLSDFLTDFGDMFSTTKVRAITLVATTGAQEAINRRLERFSDLDVEFRTCEVLPPHAYAFPSEISVWDSKDQEERALALCTNLGSRIHKQRPLGYGGLGLLVVFPTTVPNNSLPILHSFARPGSGQGWTPMFLRPNN